MKLIRKQENIEFSFKVYESDDTNEIKKYLENNKNIDVMYKTTLEEGYTYYIIEDIDYADRSLITIKRKEDPKPKPTISLRRQYNKPYKLIVKEWK